MHRILVAPAPTCSSAEVKVPSASLGMTHFLITLRSQRTNRTTDSHPEASEGLCSVRTRTTRK